MTSPIETVRVTCPECHTVYDDWYRGSINLTLDDFDEEYVEKATTATCPACGTVVHFGALLIDREGVWHLPPSSNESADGEGQPG